MRKFFELKILHYPVERCVTVVLDTSCDSKAEINLMSSFLDNFFETIYKTHNYKDTRIGLVQHDGKDSRILISPGL